MKTVSIIIPTYNESAIIEQTLSTLVCYLDGRFGRDYQLLFVDDGSRDGTADLIAALISEMAKADPASAAAEGRILSLGYEDNRGKGAAVRYGMLRARGDIRIFTDADLAYGTDVLGAFYDALATHGAPENTADAPSSCLPCVRGGVAEGDGGVVTSVCSVENKLHETPNNNAHLFMPPSGREVAFCESKMTEGERVDNEKGETATAPKHFSVGPFTPAPPAVCAGTPLPEGGYKKVSLPPAIAIGSRDIHEDGYRGYTAYRRFVSRTYRAILRGFFGLSVSDSQCGIKGFTASAAERIFAEAETNRYAFDFELITLASRAKMPILELPVCVVNNRKSRIRLLRDSARMLRDLIATKRRLGKK